MVFFCNKFVLVLVVIGLVIVGFIIWKQVCGGLVKVGFEMMVILDLGCLDFKVLFVDVDSFVEMMCIVVVVNIELCCQVQSQMDENVWLCSVMKGNCGDFDFVVCEQVCVELERVCLVVIEVVVSVLVWFIDLVDVVGVVVIDLLCCKNVLDKLGDIFSQVIDSVGQFVDQFKGC